MVNQTGSGLIPGRDQHIAVHTEQNVFEGSNAPQNPAPEPGGDRDDYVELKSWIAKRVRDFFIRSGSRSDSVPRTSLKRVPTPFSWLLCDHTTAR